MKQVLYGILRNEHRIIKSDVILVIVRSQIRICRKDHGEKLLYILSFSSHCLSLYVIFNKTNLHGTTYALKLKMKVTVKEVK